MNLLFRILIFAVAAVGISSCGTTPSGVVSNENLQTANNNAVIEAASDELDDLASVILNSAADSGSASDGRIEALSDNRLTCATFTFSNVSVDRTSGQLTISFPPQGCVDGLKSNVRKGSIIVTWSGGKWYQVGSTIVVTFNNYSLNDIVFSGTRTSKCTVFTYASPKILNVTWNITANQTLTWPDGTSANFQVNKTRGWSHSQADDQFRHTNGPDGDYAIIGTNRYGKNFTVSITSTLIFSRLCTNISKNYMPVVGTKKLTDNTTGKVFTIDYGTGSCDGFYTLSVDGVTTQLVGKNDSSND